MMAWSWECIPVVALAGWFLPHTGGRVGGMHDPCDELGLWFQEDITADEARAWTNLDDRKDFLVHSP